MPGTEADSPAPPEGLLASTQQLWMTPLPLPATFPLSSRHEEAAGAAIFCPGRKG